MKIVIKGLLYPRCYLNSTSFTFDIFTTYIPRDTNVYNILQGKKDKSCRSGLADLSNLNYLR